MQNNKKFFTALLIVLTVISTGILSVSLLNKPTEAMTESDEPVTEGYTVKEYEGKIAVFRCDEEFPIRIIDGVYVRDLPTFDRELLKTGIHAENEAALQLLLEDYDS